MTSQRAEQLSDLNRFALIHGRIVLPTAVISDKALISADGKIESIVDSPPHGIEQIDVAGRLIAPGLSDIHTHGAQGDSLNAP